MSTIVAEHQTRTIKVVEQVNSPLTPGLCSELRRIPRLG